MEIIMLLLVSAVAQLVSPASVSAQNLHNNFNHMIDLISNFNKSFTAEYFVEDVEDLYHAGCETHFFCKVHNILKGCRKITEENLEKDLEKIVHNLHFYINNRKIDCTDILKTVRKSEVSKPITTLLYYVSKCSKRINFSGPINPTTRSNS